MAMKRLTTEVTTNNLAADVAEFGASSEGISDRLLKRWWMRW